MVRRLVLVVVVAVALFADLGTAGASDPAMGGWKWNEALTKIIAQSAAQIGTGCYTWLENYTGTSYRLWKRCGVNATASGITVNEYTFPWTGNTDTWATGNPNTQYRVTQNGDGTIAVNTGGIPQSTAMSAGSKISTGSNNALQWVIPTATVHWNYTTTCTGVRSASLPVSEYGALGPISWTTVGPFIRDTSTAHNTLSGTCTGADTLLVDFGSVVPDCSLQIQVLAVSQGRNQNSGVACNCLPLGYAIRNYVTPNTCTVSNITGDPAKYGLDSVGDNKIVPGTTYTNSDLGNQTDGITGIPVIGGSSGSGMAAGDAGSGPTGSVTPGEGGNGSGSGTVVGGGSGGSGTGTGSGNCVAGAVNCNGDGSEDSGSVPSGSTFDDTITSPELGDWQSSITTFISGSPLVGALSGSHVSATSGSCSTSFSFHGHSVTIDFCARAAWFELAGTFLLIAANLGAFYIVWRN